MQGLLRIFSVALEHLGLQLSTHGCSLPGSGSEVLRKCSATVKSSGTARAHVNMYIFCSWDASKLCHGASGGTTHKTHNIFSVIHSRYRVHLQ